jgi:hypothetical protein
MATFYKYADRTASDYVDWSKIASDLSTTLLEQKKIREDKKDAIDKANRESYNTIADAPTGEDKTYSDKAIAYSGQATDQLLMINRLLKSGQMDYKDFLSQRQNIMDDTKTTFDLFKDYQTEFADRNKRLNDGTSHSLEQFAFASAEGYGNMNEYDFIVDPTTSRVYLGKMNKGKDGVPVLDKNPANYAPVQSLKARIKTKIDKFDTDAALKKGVDMMGKEIQATKKYGRIDYFGDITKRKATGEEGVIVGDYLKAEDLYISSLTNSPINTASVLTQYLKNSPEGKEYRYTWDKAEAEADKTNTLIYVEQNTGGGLTPHLNDKQTEVAKEALKARFRIMLDREHKIDAVNEPTPTKSSTSIDDLSKKKQIEYNSELVYNLRNGSESQKKTAAGAMVGLSEGAITNIDTDDPKGAKIYYADGREMFIDYSDNLQLFADQLSNVTGNQDFAIAVNMTGLGGYNAAPTTYQVSAEKPMTTSTADMASLLNPDNKTFTEIHSVFKEELEKGWYDTDESINNNLFGIAKRSIKALPAEVRKTAQISKGVKNGIHYTTISIPKRGTINIPASQDEDTNDFMEAALVSFFDAAARGRTYSPRDYSNIFQENEWYNNAFNTVNAVGATKPSGTTKKKSGADF